MWLSLCTNVIGNSLVGVVEGSEEGEINIVLSAVSVVTVEFKYYPGQ